MTGRNKPPNLYFRIREPGAAVFRVLTESAHHRLELEPIAIVSVRAGEIRSQGKPLANADRQEIELWLDQRLKSQKRRDDVEITGLIERLNRGAQWIQSRADKKTIVGRADELLFALHDLRSVIVKRIVDSEEKQKAEE